MKFNLLHIGIFLGLIFDLKDRDDSYQTTRRYIPVIVATIRALGQLTAWFMLDPWPGLYFEPEGEDSMFSRKVS
jgi:hypothetical protein